jgi:phage repressor protein C with HTH and peptisase S24 domain
MSASSTLLTLRHGEFLLLESDLDGRRETIGVLLYDPEAQRLDCKLRRDWETFIGDDDDLEIFELLEQDLKAKIAEIGTTAFLDYLESTLSNAVRLSERETVVLGNFDKTLRQLYERHVNPAVLEFRTHVPLYSLRAAAGSLGEDRPVEHSDWIEVEGERKLTEDMFAATVVGRSMEPRIADGSLCLFRRGVVGSRQGKLLLIENFRESPDGGGRYTVKRYRSEKKYGPDGEWEHERIVMEPLNPEFQTWELYPEDFRVIGEFVSVLEEPEPGGGS